MAIAFVGERGSAGATTTSATIAATVTSAVNAGERLVVTGFQNLGGVAPTCADTQGNTYDFLHMHGSGVITLAVLSANITTPLSTSDTVTVTFPAANNRRGISVQCFSGVAAASPLDSAGLAVLDTTGSNTPDAGALSLTNDDCLVYCGLHWASTGAAGTVTPGSGYTAGAIASAGATAQAAASQWKIMTGGAGTTTNTDAALSATVTRWADVAVALIPAGGGPPPSGDLRAGAFDPSLVAKAWF